MTPLFVVYDHPIPETTLGCDCQKCRDHWAKRQEFIVKTAALISEHCDNVSREEIVGCAKALAHGVDHFKLDYDDDIIRKATFYSIAEWTMNPEIRNGVPSGTTLN